MTWAFIDWETRSECNVRTTGAHNYATHRSTEGLCLGWTLEDEPVRVTPFLESAQKGLFAGRVLQEVTRDLSPLFAAVRAGALLVAHNVAFDRWIWEEVGVKKLGFPEVRPEQWRCSAAAAAHFGIPRSLKDAGEFLGLEKLKLPSRAVQAASMPKQRWRRTGKGPKYDERPEVLQELFSYCARDVEVCREIWHRCPPLSALELEVWTRDQEINRRGIPVDLELAKVCAQLHQETAEKADGEIRRVTGGKVKTAKSRGQILKWMASREVESPNLTAETVRDLLEGALPGDVREVLEIRVDGGGAASSKYVAILESVSLDGRIRDALVYYGARTGRWTGRRVQPQNLIRPPAFFAGKHGGKLSRALADEVARGLLNNARLFGSDREIMAALLRPTFMAPAGRVFICLDFSQVEARITAWMAGEEVLLDMFRRGVDVYTDMAKRIDPSNPNRQLGKAAVLGLGFGMWIDTFVDTCKAWGIDADRHLIETAVHVFRETFAKIVQLWDAVGDAAQSAIRTPDQEVPVSFIRFLFHSKTRILDMTLPSGRRLYYHRAEIAKDGIAYWARTGPEGTGKVGKIRARGSKIVENAVQAIAADLLREAIVHTAAELPEAPVVFHAHDEIVIESDTATQKGTLESFTRIVNAPPAWAGGLPIDADGWTGRRYRK